jgi:hypothetical protein
LFEVRRKGPSGEAAVAEEGAPEDLPVLGMENGCLRIEVSEWHAGEDLLDAVCGGVTFRPDTEAGTGNWILGFDAGVGV